MFQEEAVLSLIKDEQRRIRQECIVDNLAAVILQKEEVTIATQVMLFTARLKFYAKLAKKLVINLKQVFFLVNYLLNCKTLASSSM